MVLSRWCLSGYCSKSSEHFFLCSCEKASIENTGPQPSLCPINVLIAVACQVRFSESLIWPLYILSSFIFHLKYVCYCHLMNICSLLLEDATVLHLFNTSGSTCGSSTLYLCNCYSSGHHCS